MFENPIAQLCEDACDSNAILMRNETLQNELESWPNFCPHRTFLIGNVLCRLTKVIAPELKQFADQSCVHSHAKVMRS